MSASSSSPVIDIVTKYVLPTVVQTLVTASQELLSGPTAKSKQAVNAPYIDTSVILDDTTNYISVKFNNTFGYAYDGAQSIPSNMIQKEQAVLLGTGEYVGFFSNDQNQIQQYVDATFSDTIFPNDPRVAAKFKEDFLNMITARLSQASDAWVPFNTTKLYTLISDSTKTVAIDIMSVIFTASDEESVDPTKPSAFINYALCAYYTSIAVSQSAPSQKQKVMA
jgi:hypothetical protein